MGWSVFAKGLGRPDFSDGDIFFHESGVIRDLFGHAHEEVVFVVVEIGSCEEVVYAVDGGIRVR